MWERRFLLEKSGGWCGNESLSCREFIASFHRKAKLFHCTFPRPRGGFHAPTFNTLGKALLPSHPSSLNPRRRASEDFPVNSMSGAEMVSWRPLTNELGDAEVTDVTEPGSFRASTPVYRHLCQCLLPMCISLLLWLTVNRLNYRQKETSLTW